MDTKRSHPHGIAGILTAIFLGITVALAAPPDLTSGEPIPSNLTTTWNLGPTGMRGWVFYDTTSGGINGSVDSRQIEVRQVDAGSPADGILAVNDVILGADGTGATATAFSSDARKSLSLAIADAEARSPATLSLLVWSPGSPPTTTTTATITLQTMGAYTATAPYSCPKSEQILLEGMDYYYNNESSGRYRMGVLSLLAAQDNLFPDRALYLQAAETEARALIKSTSELNDLRNYAASTGYPTPWGRAHELILLGEYYLITGDPQVFETIEALAINIAKGASHYGTVAHSLRQGGYDAANSYRPVNTGYGVVNSIGMPCLLGVQLAKQCGVNDPVVDQMIDRAKMFYASYANRGAIPYGEHEPFDARHENNGKSGLAAIVLDNDPTYDEQGEFFVKMALASGDTDRDVGHTGAYFNFLWAPLGVQRGGPSAVQEYFKKISWMLDLHRRWDGGFDYDSYSENRAPNGSDYYNFRMSAAMLLTYALPLESLHITGRNSTGSLALSAGQVTDSVDVEDYEATPRTTAQLVADLGVWSPKVRRLASAELGSRTIDAATRDDLRAKALDVNGTSRYGAIQALGEIDDTAFTGQLVSLLNDNDSYVRKLAAKALHKFGGSHKVPYRSSMMTTLVNRELPVLPPVADDPLQSDQGALITTIFGSGGFANNRAEMDTLISEVGSQLFFDALKVASRHPAGSARGRVNNLYKVLTPAEVNLMAPELVDMLAVESPADRMFSLGVRAEAMRAMQRSLLAEAVPAAMQAMDNSNGWGGFHDNLLNILIGYGGSSTLVTPDPDVVGFAQSYLTGGTAEEAQALLDAIAADANPTTPTAFKSIDSATADDPILTLPADSTILRVSGSDYLQGDSIYTWNKIAGPGAVTISPNGTAGTASTVQFDGTAGTYQFEVTMSDSLGLTEVHEVVTVFVVADGEIDDDPPIPNPGSFDGYPIADGETSVSMTATIGSDASGPVEYLFSEITGNPGGSSSGWQTSPAYTDSGLSPLTQYAYMVTMRDSLGNIGSTSSTASVTTPGIPAPSDIISVNFYSYGGLGTEDRDAVTLEANETAGFGGWRTGGWENYAVPWGLSSPASPVAITSGLGSSATLILNDLRNGGPYNNPNPHVLLVGDGNGDLMDGHCNGTEDPGDESAKFDMVVSDVPFGTYDLIVYVGANKGQFGNGTGKFVFNGGAEQDFKLTSGEFMSFAEITNGTTPGNYLLFENVTGTSFTLRMWGNGFNHIGPTGFQISNAGTTSDVDPPTPNAASFATPPQAGGADSISMTATAGTDVSGPVEYLFSCLTAGGHGSGWQTSPSYTDSGLNPDTEYVYTVTMRDARGNTGSTSNPASATTMAGADVTPPFLDPAIWASAPAPASDTSITMTAMTASDPSGVEYYFTSTSGGGNDSGWQDSPTYTDTGLTPATTYAYTVTVRDKSPAQNTSAPSDPTSGTTSESSPLAPLKVFILAGQSNMEGHGEMNPAFSQGTLDYLVSTDPATYGHLKVGANWATFNDVWISYKRGGTTLLNGDLSAGFGVQPTTIGPELQFGVELGNYLGEQVLLIKTAWGGKSLYVDFRPPTSGWSLNPPVSAGDQGFYYQEMLNDVSSVVANLSTYFPDYTTIGSYEFAGFGWHQGWNDRVNSAAVAEYEANMENFIIDVRSDLAAIHPSGANIPFVIATTGIGGPDETGTSALALMDAQLAMEDFVTYPAFEDNVAVVDTREFWREASESPADQGFHWNRNAETYFRIGQSMATHMRVLLDGGDTTPPDPSPMTWATTPTAAGEGEITMTASTATDIIGVEYFFEETSGNPGGDDSGWQDSPTYLDTGLSNSTSYSYRVRARDKSPDQNETGLSSLESATTTPADTTAPTPNPMTWAIAPTPLSSRVITMTADTASDPSGVEYFFTNTTISGHDSGWQDSPKYTDAGLEPSTSYTYEVKARDKSVAATETAPSAGTVATTLAPPAPGPLIYEPFDDLDPNLNGNTPGLGLSGTWSAASAVTPGSLSYGSLATSGGRVTTGGGQFQQNGISPGDTLTNAGLMVDGSTLWFSVLMVNYNSVPAPTTDNRTYLALGTGNADGFDRIGGTAGSGFTVALSKVSAGGVTAQAWNDGSDGTGGASRGSTVTVANDATFLAVGKITWGEFGVADDVFELYLPGTDLVQGSPISTIAADFDQLGVADAANAFDTISVTGGRPNLGVPEFDEIRFGATYADVVINANDNTAPTPDPMTWASVPTALGEDQITMTASTATDPSGVEYFFDETSGNPGATDSGWQDSPSYIDTGLDPSTTYSYQVRARDKSPGQNETGLSPLESATTMPPADSTPPTPDPMTWASVPTALGEDQITMTASTATDSSGVEYFFDETSGNPGATDSGWQDSPSYIDTGLDPSTTYSYQVRARDKSSAQNETGLSPLESATTMPPADSTPPTPDPMTWASVPTALGEDQITMTASTATDPSGVEYFFDETSGNPGATDSGWQDSPTYVDTGLDPSTTYSYQVRARDKSPGQNETGLSPLESATTTMPPADNTPPTPDPMTWASVPTATSGTAITMTASTATDSSGVEYFFDETSGNPGGADSGWQDSPTYVDTGLDPSTTYSYQVRARDKSSAQNETGVSPLESAITDGTPTGALIYEPFDDLDPNLNGNTAGLGLDGTWSPGESNVADGSLIYGRLAYSGGRVVTNPGDQFDVNGVSPGTTLTGAGLLDDGATLWFSCLIVKAAQVSSSGDRRVYVSLGTGTPDGFDRIGGNGGSGLCVAVNKTSNGVEARGWNDGSDGGGGAFSGGADTSVADGDTFLAVGKITWGAFGTPGSDVFELYLPDEDLNMGTPVSTLNADFDQLGTANAANLFDTIGIAGGRPQNFVPEVDEIRFGATYADVTPVDVTAPVVVSTDPVDDSPSGNGAQQVATFDEPIFIGTGDIRLVNDTDTVTTTIPVGDPQVVVSGNTLTITPTGGLVGNKAYHIEIDTGAVKNFNEIDFAGISDPTAWNFIADGTPPSVVSITDSVSPLPLLTATSVTHTVTFNEAIDAGTIDVADFGNGGSASVTIDSVTATANPAVFDVLVSAVGPGTLTLEVVSGAVILDLTGNPLDTTSAIPDDTTITVNDPTPTAASTSVDFQSTIASEQHPTYPNEARYFHVSVNPANPGTGSYAATIVGTNNPAPRFVRNYTGPVEAYWFGSGANSNFTVGMQGGPNPGIIGFTTEDDTFDGFAQGQAKVWDATDPGADLATSGPGTGDSDLPYIAAADKNSGLWRSLGGATGTVDISALPSGSLHIYYGAFGAKPSVRVTMKDTDNVAADIVIADAHLNGDSADRSEYYLAEIDFVTDGFYDVIEFEWLANGTDYLGNGRGVGLVVTGPDVLSDYETWADIYAPADLSDPDADNDGDGLTNDYERLFGLNPTSGASVNPISVPLDAAGGTFSFTRRDPLLTGTFTDIETSTDLAMWTKDSGAALTVSGTVDNVQTVDVVLSPGLLTATKLFVRVNQNDGTVFSENFEDDNGGFTLVGAPNDWEYGTPNANNGAGLILTGGNGGSTNCWATVLGSGGLVGAGAITAASDSILRSPDIDLTSAASAQLQFAAAIDANTGDTLEVLVKEVGTDLLLETVTPVAVPYSDTDWENYGPFAIPAAAGKDVYLEFRFLGNDTDYIGFYLDDVTVQQVAP